MPSGDQPGTRLSRPGLLVRFVAPLPSACITKISPWPARSDPKAICVPSGDQTALSLLLSPAGQLLDPMAAEIHHVDVVFTGAVRGKGDLCAIGRPGRGVAAAPGFQQHRIAAVRRCDIELPGPTLAGAKHELPAVGRPTDAVGPPAGLRHRTGTGRAQPWVCMLGEAVLDITES